MRVSYRALAVVLALCLLCGVATAQMGTSRLQNNSGGTVNKYAVVVQDTSAASSFTTTSTSRAGGVLGILWAQTANGATGPIIIGGIAEVAVTGNVSIGDFLVTSTTAGRATSGGSLDSTGAFALALQASSTETEILCYLLPANAVGISITSSSVGDLSDVSLDSIEAGQILVVNAGEDALENVTMSGDATIDETGAVTIATATGATDVDAGTKGLTPAPAAGDHIKYLRGDMTYANPEVGVSGPGTVTNRALAAWDGTDGSTIQNTGLFLDSTLNNLYVPGVLYLAGTAVSNSIGLIDGGRIQVSSIPATRLTNTGVSAGSYTNANITVTSTGVITSAASGTMTYLTLTDTPSTYTNGSLKLLRVNTGETAVEFGPLGTATPTASAIPIAGGGGKLDVGWVPILVGDSGAGGTAGLAPAPGAGDAAAGKYLGADGTYTVPKGSGNVAGPAGSTDNAIAVFDGETGQTLQDSGVTLTGASLDGINIPSNAVIVGTITAGSGSHALTNSAGLIDGGKLQDATVTNTKLAALTEAQLQALLSDVTDVFTNNDTDYGYLINAAGTAGHVWTSQGSGRGAWAAPSGGGATAFTDLTDAPSDYTDQGGKIVAVTDNEDGLEFIDAPSGSGSSTFLGLTDTPSSFDGASSAYVKVNSAGNALEFIQGGGGSAEPDTLCVFLPRDAMPAATNYATLDTRNNHAVLDFDAATDETVYFTGVLPIRYGGGGVTVEIHYAMTSATSGSVVLDAAFENLADEAQDIDSDGFAAAQSVTQAVSDTSGKVKRASITFTDGAQMDSVSAGGLFRLLIRRDADNGSDDATGDLELLAVHVKETAP